MEDYIKAKELMDMDATELIGSVSEREIENAMQSLSVVFPESYKAFLRDFGGGDVGGELIFGITGEDNAITATQMERTQGLSADLVIIGFWNDTLICLDTGRMDNGECPVVEVDEEDRVTEVIADSFGQFLYEYLEAE